MNMFFYGGRAWCVPSKYARLAVDKSIAEEFYKRLRRIGRRSTDVLNAVLSAVNDAIYHGYDPVDMVHICRIARSLGLGRAGYSNGYSAGLLLRAYYSPRDFLDVLTRVGPQIFSAYRTGPDTFKCVDGEARETLRGILEGLGCRTGVDGEVIRVHCDG